MIFEKPFTKAANKVAHAAGLPATFIICCVAIVVWAATGPIFGFSDTWQLIVNTATTIITFLMVALLQNSQTRADAAVQDKLNAIAAALAVLMDKNSGESPKLADATRELRQAVGLEDRESS